MFAEKEFHRVSTAEVAEHAGTGKGTVYRHFASKEVLYVAATIHDLGRLRKNLRAAFVETPSSRARIEAIVGRLLAYFWNKHDFFFLLRNFAGLPQDYRRRYELERRKLSLLLRRALSAGVDEGVLRSDLNVALAAEALLGMMRAGSRVRFDSVSLPQATDAAVALFLNGCVARANP